MTKYEYKVVPAPRQAEKLRDTKGLEARFAATLASLMNFHGAQGWDYVRSETMEAEDRRMLGKNRSEEVTVLIFRREAEDADATAPAPKPALGPATEPRVSEAPGIGPARPAKDEDDTAAA